MRNRFEQQFQLGVKAISETTYLLKSRDDIPAITAALLEIFNNNEYNDKIFSILEKRILKGKKATGRKGLNLWQIFVLAQFRLGLNLDYDRLHYMTYSDSTLRQLLGIETEVGFDKIEIGYQRIIDNLHLLDDATLIKINDVIVELGHNVFKKKEAVALSLKTDSFVVESNVHFPTDYNLLWDSSRKAIATIDWFTDKYTTIEGWRKSKNWFKSLKNLSREVGQVSSSGGKDKDVRVKAVASKYLVKARAFKKKTEGSKSGLPVKELADVCKIYELERFIELMDKHIDLVERRLLKGEKIPHQEKLFSIFEEYTEWITKGKMRPNVELGKKVSITTDQYGLIVDHYVMENEADSEIVLKTADRILSRYNAASWSFDKGYWHKDNKYLLGLYVEEVVMPKKGKCNKQEYEQEHKPKFKKLKNKHSAVESNINELEHRGLDRCPDRTFKGFKRYVAIAVTAYNLHRIGKELLKQKSEEEKRHRQQQLKLAA